MNAKERITNKEVKLIVISAVVSVIAAKFLDNFNWEFIWDPSNIVASIVRLGFTIFIYIFVLGVIAVFLVKLLRKTEFL